jgi:hypothetical protein
MKRIWEGAPSFAPVCTDSHQGVGSPMFAQSVNAILEAEGITSLELAI